MFYTYWYTLRRSHTTHQSPRFGRRGASVYTYLEDDAEDPEVDLGDRFGDERVHVEPEAGAVGRCDDTEHGVVGRTEDDGRRDDGADGDAGSPQSADAHSDRRVTDGEIAEHRQRHG